jgi:NhaA family Na+:H+ antiporter
MTQQVLSHRALSRPTESRRWASLIGRFVLDRFLLLPLGAAIALVWANAAPDTYFRVARFFAFPVNEIGMAFFLAFITQQAFEAVMPGGALHTWRRWGVPLVAAAGGLIGAAVVFVGYVYTSHEQVLAQAWPTVCAIDAAAAYYLLRLVYRRKSALSFLLVLAFATDAVALVLLGTGRPLTGDAVVGGALFATAIGYAALLRVTSVQSFWQYWCVSGIVSWIGLYIAGVHPALALVPIVPFLPHLPRRLDLFADVPDDGPVHRAEHEWDEAVQVVVFLFGLVNAGVLLRGYDTGTWAVLAASLLGRPLGILAGIGVAVVAGLHLPRHFGWRDAIVVALATSSGFTLALFFASGLLPVGAVLQQIKIGALATAVGAVLAFIAARALRAGRFASNKG